MLLNNLLLVNGREPVNILTGSGTILSIQPDNPQSRPEGQALYFTEAAVCPGLINSHDHLDFNCFSPLGGKKYSNYTAWGEDIHDRFRAEIQKVLEVPLALRALWGMYKNLLCGVTTVVHHGDPIKIEDPLITIHQKAQSLHSVRFEKNWKWKLNNPVQANRVCAMHVGEGTDHGSAREIDQLLRFNFLNRRIVGIHGVAMNEQQSKKFAGLVWCPASNEVLLRKHACIKDLQKNTRVVFGTDSTLTAGWNVWEHLRLARSLRQVPDTELFQMITAAPARLWGLNSGSLEPGRDADMIVVRAGQPVFSENDFLAITPENIVMVVHKGRIRMFDKSMYAQVIPGFAPAARFSSLSVNGRIKYVEGDLPFLLGSVLSHYPEMPFPVHSNAWVKDAAYD